MNFGQPSLRSLQQHDDLIRNTKRRLPAHIAFLDEGYATSLNALLRLMNERVFENPEPQPVPLLFCVVRHNVPQDEDLSAFVDRFVYRPWLRYVRNLSSKRESTERGITKPSVSVRLTLDEIKTMQAAAANVPYSDELVEDLVKCQVALSEKGFTSAIASFSNW